MSEQEAKELLDSVEQEHKRLDALGKLGRAEADMAKWAGDEAQKMRLAAALKRKQAALNIMARDRVDAQIATFRAEVPKKPVEAILSVLVGSYRKATGARASIGARRIALTEQWIAAGLMRDISERPHVLGLLKKDKRFLADIVREMYEIRENGRPGITGNDDARWAAGLFSQYSEHARLRLNEAGANIGKLGGWVPQGHDEAKLLKVGMEKWINTIFPMLDHERTFREGATDESKRAMLREAFDDIVTGRARGLTPAQAGEFVGPRNLARSLEKHRVLHFRDADTWLKYAAQFNTGNVFTSVISNLEMSARKLALMETLGPNPEVMLTAIVETMRRDIRENPGLDSARKQKLLNQLAGDIGKRNGKIGKAFAEVMGETNIPHNVTAAKISAGVRALQSMAKLGGAVLSSIADIMTKAMAARHAGINLLEAYGNAFESLMVGRGSAEQRRIAMRLGVLYDGMLGEIVARWNAQDSMPGKMSNMMNTFFRWSGMTWWTDVQKAGYARMLSAHIADVADSAWDDLPVPEREMLKYHGFDSRKWDVIRSVAEIEDDGVKYLTPDRIRDADDELLDAINEERLEAIAERMKLGKSESDEVNASREEKFEAAKTRLREETRKRLETEYMALFSDETKFAVIEPDDRTRMALKQGTRPGTLLGEVMRFVTQFKSFPIAYGQRILMGRRFQQPGRGADLMGISHMIAASLVFGYAAGAAKDFVKGRKPKDPRKLETWLSALAQSGGAGIYGDFLLSKYDRFGRGPIDTASGPTAGTAGEVVQMLSGLLRGETDAGDAFRLAMNNTPFINLWYTRAALDWAILFHVREMLSPGTLARTERRMKEEYNQEYLLPPSTVIKRGGWGGR